MMKIIFLTLCVLIVTLQVIPTSEAFIIKTVSIEKGFSSPTYSQASIDAYTQSKNDLLQTVSNAVTEKINTITSFVNGLVRLKARAGEDLWRSTVNASNGVIRSVNGIIAAKPVVFTKTISVGLKPLFVTTTTLPASTTVASGAIATTTTTTGQTHSGYYSRRS